MYIAGCTRGDIQFAANQLGRYMLNPMTKHLQKAKRVVRYLKQTVNAKLIFKKHKHDALVVYAIADFGNFTAVTRKLSKKYLMSQVELYFHLFLLNRLDK